jgi:hypothetical protein
VFAGENPLIMLYRPGGEDLVAVASLWRARYTAQGSGTSLLLWADPGPSSSSAPVTAAVCTDDPPLARWLWSTFNSRWEPLLGHGLEEVPPTPSRFAESRADGEHRVVCSSAELTVELVWRQPQGCIWTETYPYEYITTAAIVPCLDASIIVNGRTAIGEVRPHSDVFASSAILAFCETWLSRT